jgi:hypothetical protein
LKLGETECFKSIINDLKIEKLIPTPVINTIWKMYMSEQECDKTSLLTLIRFMADTSFLTRKFSKIATMSLTGDWPLIAEGLRLAEYLDVKDNRSEQFLSSAINKVMNERDGTTVWF